MVNFKNFGPLEALVLFSAIYVLSTLIWTASTRSAVQEKANIVKSNHKTIINFLNNVFSLLIYSIVKLLNLLQDV